MDPIQQPTQVQSSQIPQQPEPPQRKFPVALFVLGGIFLLFIGLLGGYFLSKTLSPQQTVSLSPTPSFVPTVTPIPTTGSATMQTYTHLGMSLQYPLDWKITDVFPPGSPGSQSSPAFVGFTPVNVALGGEVPPIYIEQYDNPNDLSLKAYEDSVNATRALASTFYYADATPLTVGGFPAYRKNTGCEPLLCTKVTVMAQHIIYIFIAIQDTNTANYTSGQLGAYKSIFDQILSSVTFTK